MSKEVPLEAKHRAGYGLVLAGLVASSVLVASAASATPGHRSAAVGWTQVASPNVGANANELGAVAEVSSADAWAVGVTQGDDLHDRTLAMRWDGQSWSVVPTPNVGADHNSLFAVAATSATDAWAVGNYFDDGSLAWKTLAMHWGGTSWTVVETPSPRRRFSTLLGIAAISPSDAWAVGARQTSGPTIRNLPLVEHWDGASWTVARTPRAGGSSSSFLQGVAATSSTDAWAVGFRDTSTLIEHWDGSSWAVVPSPNPFGRTDLLHSVAALSSTDAWAVGGGYLNDEGTSERTLAEHWDGTNWSVVSTPNQGSVNNQLLGVAAPSSHGIWAVGLFVDALTNENRTLTERWDGTAWSIVPSPSPGEDAVLLGVTAARHGPVWAVGGFDQPPEQTLVLRNGSV
jgi:hypothetical protein